MEGPTSSWGSRNRIIFLTLQEHDDDDDNDDDDDDDDDYDDVINMLNAGPLVGFCITWNTYVKR